MSMISFGYCAIMQPFPEERRKSFCRGYSTMTGVSSRCTPKCPVDNANILRPIFILSATTKLLPLITTTAKASKAASKHWDYITPPNVRSKDGLPRTSIRSTNYGKAANIQKRDSTNCRRRKSRGQPFRLSSFCKAGPGTVMS